MYIGKLTEIGYKKGKKITQIKQVITETGKPVITDTGKILFVKLGV